MGKLNVFDITLNNPQAVYTPGQVVAGNVTVELNEEMKMRGIRLLFYGGARVRWSETRSTGKSTYTVVYSATETYFNNEITVFGKAPGASGDTPSLGTGRHVFPFQFHLPTVIPSSFEGSFGRVRYWISAEIDKPWKFNHRTKTAFTVFSLLDLNKIQGVGNTVQQSGSKNLCCLCCKSGPISVALLLDRAGYVPGDSIPIRGEVTNHSNRRLKRSFAQVEMRTTFHATSKSRTVSTTVAELSKAEIPPGHSDSWNGEALRLPPLPPSDLPGCRIIAINYFVKLCADPAGPAFDLEVPIKIIVGNIPLASAYRQHRAPPPAMPSSSQLYPEAWQPSASSSSSIPPPTYAESTFGNVDIRDDDDSTHTRGNMNYAPKYAYYNWDQPSVPTAPPNEGS